MSQIFEAVLLLSKGKIIRELRYAEFESLLDGFIPESQYANQTLQAVYLQLSNSLQIEQILFFVLAFDGKGLADSRWNLPITQLASQGDLQAGIRIYPTPSALTGQWAALLWHPSTHLSALVKEMQSRVKQNRLGFYSKASSQAPTQPQPTQEPLNQQAQQQLLQLKQEYDALFEEKVAVTKALRQSQQQLIQRQTLADDKQGALDELNREHLFLFNNLARVSQLNDTNITRIAQLQQQIQQQEQQAEQEIDSLQAELLQLELEKEQFQLQLDAHKAEVRAEFVSQIQQASIKLNVWLDGAGEQLLDASELTHYLTDPERFAAQVCGVSRGHYVQWRRHYQSPLCSHCGKAAARVANPSDYVDGYHDYCDLHQAAFGKKPS